MTTTVNPRSIGVEGRYLGADVYGLAELRQRMLVAGVPSQTANGIVGWITAKIAGQPDTTSAPTRSTYRKVLAELDGSSPPKRDGRRHNRPADNPRGVRYVAKLVAASRRAPVASGRAA